MKINWKVRMRNKSFWLALVPAALLLIQVTAAALGFPVELEGLEGRLLDIVNALFAVLTILGVVQDPTTAGLGDSERALAYTAPGGREAEGG